MQTIIISMCKLWQPLLCYTIRFIRVWRHEQYFINPPSTNMYLNEILFQGCTRLHCWRHIVILRKTVFVHTVIVFHVVLKWLWADYLKDVRAGSAGDFKSKKSKLCLHARRTYFQQEDREKTIRQKVWFFHYCVEYDQRASMYPECVRKMKDKWKLSEDGVCFFRLSTWQRIVWRRKWYCLW